MATPPPPPIPPKRSRSFSTGLLIGVLIPLVVGAVIFGGVLLARRNGPKVAAPLSPTPPPLARPSVSPSPGQKPDATRLQLTGKFSDRGWQATGERLRLYVGQESRGDCQIHLYKPKGTKALRAFLSDCSSWENSGTDILIFFVGIGNTSNRALSFDLRNFVLASRDGRTFGPVNVRSQATQPPDFLPETGKILPHSYISGNLTFDGRVTGLVPDSLNYVDGNQTLTVVLDGKPLVR
jgi:hypothetical protein